MAGCATSVQNSIRIRMISQAKKCSAIRAKLLKPSKLKECKEKDNLALMILTDHKMTKEQDLVRLKSVKEIIKVALIISSMLVMIPARFLLSF